MPEPETVTPPPAEVTPPPQIPPPTAGMITRAQYEADMNKARSDEKQKQFDRIKQLEDEVKKLKEDYLTVSGQFSALNAAQSQEGKVDTKKLIDEVSSAATRASENKFLEMQKEIDRLSRENSYERLERFRQKAIVDAGGPEKLVVSLVRGITEEEILASVSEAKTEYEKIAQRFAPTVTVPPIQTPAEQNRGTVTPPPQIAPVTTPGVGREAGESVIDTPGAIKKMTPEEYKERRGDIKNQLKERYPRKVVA